MGHGRREGNIHQAKRMKKGGEDVDSEEGRNAEKLGEKMTTYQSFANLSPPPLLQWPCHVMMHTKDAPDGGTFPLRLLLFATFHIISCLL